MGRDEKDKRDSIEEALETQDDAMSAPAEPTVVDDEYLAGLRARLEDDVTLPPVDRRRAYEDVSTEKLQSDMRDPTAARKRKSSSYPAPIPAQVGDSMYVLCGPDAGRSYLLEADGIRVGRGGDNDVVLNDTSVSRNHLKLTRAVDGWLFEDLGSENGTYLDDAYVKTGKVAYGQALEVGRSIIIIERGEPG
jgi:hypothetical protein